MHTPFTFESTGSERADAFLKARADHLLTLNSAARQVFLEKAIVLAKQLPIDSVSGAMVKAQVVVTLQRWLDEVSATVSA